MVFNRGRIGKKTTNTKNLLYFVAILSQKCISVEDSQVEDLPRIKREVILGQNKIKRVQRCCTKDQNGKWSRKAAARLPVAEEVKAPSMVQRGQSTGPAKLPLTRAAM